MNVSYEVEKLLEIHYHFSMLEDCKTEEQQQWENMRHEKAIKNINENDIELERD